MDPSQQPQQVPNPDQPQPPVSPSPEHYYAQASTPQEPVNPAQPYAPQQPAQTQVYGAPAPYPQAQPAGKNSKIIILIACIVGGLMLLAGALIAALLIFSGPTRADYSRAAEKVTEANSAYNAMLIKAYDLTSSSSTETSRKNAQETVETKMATFNTALDQAGKMKAVKRDKDIAAKYSALEAKRARFNDSVDKLIDISEKFVPVYVDLSDLSTNSTATDLSTAQTKLEGIGTLKDDATNTFVTASINFLKAVGQYQAYHDAYLNGGDYSANEYTKYSAATDTYYDALKDWQSSLEKMTDDSDLHTELNALATAINTKLMSK